MLYLQVAVIALWVTSIKFGAELNHHGPYGGILVVVGIYNSFPDEKSASSPVPNDQNGMCAGRMISIVKGLSSVQDFCVIITVVASCHMLGI